MQAVVMVEPLLQSAHPHGQEIDLARMPRPTRGAGLVEQAPERRRINSSGNPPGVVQQGRDDAQRDVLGGEVPVRLPSQEHPLKLAPGGRLAGEANTGSPAIALEQRRLGRLGQIPPEHAQ